MNVNTYDDDNTDNTLQATFVNLIPQEAGQLW